MKKLQSLALALTAFALLGTVTACSDQKMEDLPSRPDSGPAQTKGSAPTSKVDGVELYPYGCGVLNGNPSDKSENVYSFTVKGADIFPSFQAAGISAQKDLDSSAEGKAFIHGKLEKVYSSDGTLTKGFGVLTVDVQVKAVSVPQKEENPNVAFLRLLKKSELKSQANSSFLPQILYNSKAPKKNREKEYYTLPPLKSGEKTDCRIGWVMPKSLLRNNALILGVSDGGSTCKYGVALTFSGEGGNSSS